MRAMPNPAALPTSTAAVAPPDSALPAVPLIDQYGRQITYLRLSITDRCDFRCTYCMSDAMQFLPRDAVLSLEECLRLVRCFVALGVRKVRITGGEPLVRRNVLWLLARLGALPGLDNLVLTTNGSQLGQFAPTLKTAGVKRLNISLDTLRAERFRSITRIGELSKVLAGIRAAGAAGFTRTKINVVMMRGVNEDEFVDLVNFAVAEGLDISFIEEMPLGAIERERAPISAEEVRGQLAAHFSLQPSDENSGGPARYWRLPDSPTRVGFIEPHSHNFCADCNRVRVTARGELYPCLGHNDAVDLLPLLRAGASDAELKQALQVSMGMKPLQHDFSQQMEKPQVVRFMSMTGG
ncbi:GTP 3',8-cyclase MoaA [Azonexus sp.]|uniref:GTP 3',8-cyclase MoaA n=1 Tax=Azonexus sp. TaxID=1872668 RepID=UPI0039E72A62